MNESKCVMCSSTAGLRNVQRGKDTWAVCARCHWKCLKSDRHKARETLQEQKSLVAEVLDHGRPEEITEFVRAMPRGELQDLLHALSCDLHDQLAALPSVEKTTIDALSAELRRYTKLALIYRPPA